jgi:hypothetical protein
MFSFNFLPPNDLRILIRADSDIYFPFPSLLNFHIYEDIFCKMCVHESKICRHLGGCLSFCLYTKRKFTFCSLRKVRQTLLYSTLPMSYIRNIYGFVGDVFLCSST